MAKNDPIDLTKHTITREPLPKSEKIYVEGKLYSEIRVPMREISLTNGEKVTVYDTSGPYTDPNIEINVRKGINEVRRDWVVGRGDVVESVPFDFLLGLGRVDVVVLDQHAHYFFVDRDRLFAQVDGRRVRGLVLVDAEPRVVSDVLDREPLAWVRVQDVADHVLGLL